jgi:hypothetical protein
MLLYALAPQLVSTGGEPRSIDVGCGSIAI